jgi:hypothetical protein
VSSWGRCTKSSRNQSTASQPQTNRTCKNPQIAEQGSHKELTALKGIYYSLVRRQQKGLSERDMDLSPMYPPLMSCECFSWGGW